MRRLLFALLLTLTASNCNASGVHVYAQHGQLRELRAMIEADPSQLEARDEHQRTPLHYAVWSGHKPTVEYLLAKGANIEATDKYRAWTPIFFSVLSHKQHITPILLKAGADLERRDNIGRTPIFELRSAEQIEYNYQLGAKLDVVDNEGGTPLSFVAGRETIECVEYYLSHGLSARGANDNGHPLQRAVEANDMTTISMLLQHGADPNTAIEKALYHKDTMALSLLVRNGGKLESGGEALLRRILYVDRGDSGQYSYFLRNVKLDPSARFGDGATMLHFAAKTLNARVVQSLIQLGADVNARDSNGDTPLHMLTTHGPSGVMCGNVFDEDWSTYHLYDPATGKSEERLMVCSEGHDTMSVRVARLLVGAGAQLDIKGYDGDTPLLRLYPSWNRSAMKLLIERGADVNATDNHGTKVIERLKWSNDKPNVLLELARKYGARE